MDMISDEFIKSSVDRGSAVLQLNGSSSTVNITEVELAIRDFAFALLATSPDYDGELLGYSGFVSGGSSLLEAEPSFLELRMLKVDPAYFRRGLGRTLLAHSKALSTERGNTLILKPQRPAVTGYPLTTEELKVMYMNDGFREFTPDEVDDLSGRIDDAYLSLSLWFEGIDPETAQLTGERRYSRTREQAASLDHIPFEDKLSLMAEVLTGKYGHANALDSNRRSHRRTVEEHLVMAIK